MYNREIPRNQWVSFLDGFSKEHQGWIVNLQVTENGVQNKQEARDLPLMGISADLKHGDDDTIEVMLGNNKSQPMNHMLSKVKKITLQQNDQGADTGLVIEGSDGKATIQFRNPAKPENVDAISKAQR